MPQAAKDELRAYPRQRGGTRGSDPNRRRGGGLSPPARGNPRGLRLFGVLLGPIPASAGEPQMTAVSKYLPRAYPRQRGGTATYHRDPAWVQGLSPPARGNQRRAVVESDRGGPIPASAGEPCSPRSPRRSAGAYPRQRGGTEGDGDAVGIFGGLSPPARGNPADFDDVDDLAGPIPASAGEPIAGAVQFGGQWAYPRQRGGTQHTIHHTPSAAGLSPPARGNQ